MTPFDFEMTPDAIMSYVDRTLAETASRNPDLSIPAKHLVAIPGTASRRPPAVCSVTARQILLLFVTEFIYRMTCSGRCAMNQSERTAFDALTPSELDCIYSYIARHLQFPTASRYVEEARLECAVPFFKGPHGWYRPPCSVAWHMRDAERVPGPAGSDSSS